MENTFLFNKVVDHCIKINTEEYNLLKLAEEATELSEVCLKRVTKHKDYTNRPEKIEILKEAMDVVFRANIALKSTFPEMTDEELAEECNSYIETKMIKYSKLIDENKYPKNL